MFHAFLIATDTTTIKTERKALSLRTKRFLCHTKQAHQSFELDASAMIDCRDQSATTTQEGKNKRKVGLAKIMKLDVVGIY
jgi:hypothetical protein